MKKLLILPLLFFTISLSAQQLEGAWKLISQNQVPVSGQEFIKIYQDNYFAFGIKNLTDNSFVGAGGGPFAMTSGKLQETLDFYAQSRISRDGHFLCRTSRGQTNYLIGHDPQGTFGGGLGANLRCQG